MCFDFVSQHWHWQSTSFQNYVYFVVVVCEANRWAVSGQQENPHVLSGATLLGGECTKTAVGSGGQRRCCTGYRLYGNHN